MSLYSIFFRFCVRWFKNPKMVCKIECFGESLSSQFLLVLDWLYPVWSFRVQYLQHQFKGQWTLVFIHCWVSFVDNCDMLWRASFLQYNISASRKFCCAVQYTFEIWVTGTERCLIDFKKFSKFTTAFLIIRKITIFMLIYSFKSAWQQQRKCYDASSSNGRCVKYFCGVCNFKYADSFSKNSPSCSVPIFGNLRLWNFIGSHNIFENFTWFLCLLYHPSLYDCCGGCWCIGIGVPQLSIFKCDCPKVSKC